jgi:D-alanyl-D-alanine carboxypeptidase (penicillin-binding protein 5/6)
MKIRRILSVFLLTVLLVGLFCVPPAHALEDPDIQAGAALLVDAETGHVLYDKNAKVQHAPASLTKIMVALLVLEAVDRGELKMDEEITATASSLAGLLPDSSTAGIRAGETLTVENLMYCLMVHSANEVGDIFGERLCGTADKFVDRMNERAAELGCTQTHFINTSGFPDHYSSAWDVYLMIREAMKYPDFMRICNTKSYTVPATNLSGPRELHTTNGLIGNWIYAGYLYDGAAGIKTGTTPEAGRCLASTATRGGRTLISVVLGAGISEDGRIMSFTETARLFDWGFDNWVYQTVLQQDQPQSVSVDLSKETDTVFVYPETNPQLLLPKDLDMENDPDFVCTVEKPDSVDAPVEAGQELGTVTITYRGEEYAKVPLLAAANVPVSRFLVARRTVMNYLSLYYVKLGLIVLAVLIVLLIVWGRLIRPRARRGGKRYRGRRR